MILKKRESDGSHVPLVQGNTLGVELVEEVGTVQFPLIDRLGMSSSMLWRVVYRSMGIEDWSVFQLCSWNSTLEGPEVEFARVYVNS